MKVVIEGAAPWDGSYEFDDFGFTNRELHRIKQISGLRAGELIEALEANDTAAYVSVAVVVMGRNGKTVEPDDLWDAKVGSITLDLGGDDADPPTTASSGNDPSEPESSSGDGSGTGGG